MIKNSTLGYAIADADFESKKTKMGKTKTHAMKWLNLFPLSCNDSDRLN